MRQHQLELARTYDPKIAYSACGFLWLQASTHKGIAALTTVSLSEVLNMKSPKIDVINMHPSKRNERTHKHGSCSKTWGLRDRRTNGGISCLQSIEIVEVLQQVPPMTSRSFTVPYYPDTIEPHRCPP